MWDRHSCLSVSVLHISAKHFSRNMPLVNTLHEHALNNIRYIRDAMERATAFTSIPGWGGCAIGVTALVTTVVASKFVVQPRLWLLTWLAEAVVAALIATFTMVRKARRANVSFKSASTRRFF